MMIRELTGDGFPIESSKKRVAPPLPQTDSVSGGRDRVALSGEAMALYASAEEARVEEIRAKIQDGYYCRHDVLESIVNALLEDLKKGDVA